MRCPFCGSSYIMHRMVCPNCNNAMDSTLIAKLQQYSAQYNNVKFINFDINMFLEDIVNWFNTYGGNIHLLEVWGDLVDISRFPHITKMNWGFRNLTVIYTECPDEYHYAMGAITRSDSFLLPAKMIVQKEINKCAQTVPWHVCWVNDKITHRGNYLDPSDFDKHEACGVVLQAVPKASLPAYSAQ